MNPIAFFMSLSAVAVIEFGLGHARFLPPLYLIGLARCLEAGAILLVLRISGHGPEVVGLDRSRMKRGLRQGLIWSSVFGAIAGISGSALFLAGLNPLVLIHVGLPQTMTGVALFFVVGGVIAPIAEELFFRGVMYGYLRKTVFKTWKSWGIWPSLFISTLLFVTAHRVGAAIPLPQLAGGIVFCLAYEIEKSLVTPIIIHALGNLALFTLSCF